nr:MAG TPA: hypothetical protein [Caudoviricetes sp.]
MEIRQLQYIIQHLPFSIYEKTCQKAGFSH